MKGKWLLLVCLPLLLSFLPCAMIGQTRVKASDDLPVHNLNTGLNYTTIQEAIDASETMDGHTIKVDSGTYYEHISIEKSITLVGEDSDATVIDGNSARFPNFFSSVRDGSSSSALACP
jgi:pectin methylesterase-like acyl-CoA thioesterase